MNKGKGLPCWDGEVDGGEYHHAGDVDSDYQLVERVLHVDDVGCCLGSNGIKNQEVLNGNGMVVTWLIMLMRIVGKKSTSRMLMVLLPSFAVTCATARKCYRWNSLSLYFLEIHLHSCFSIFKERLIHPPLPDLILRNRWRTEDIDFFRHQRC